MEQDEFDAIKHDISSLKSMLMDVQDGALKVKITEELKRAIRNINRNLQEWLGEKRVNFKISYNEVNGLCKNWLIRCLRSVMDASTADRIFRSGHFYIYMDDATSSIRLLSVSNHPNYRSWYTTACMIDDIFKSLNYKDLRYNADDYKMDGVTQRDDAFYYPRYEPIDFNVTEYKLPKT